MWRQCTRDTHQAEIVASLIVYCPSLSLQQASLLRFQMLFLSVSGESIWCIHKSVVLALAIKNISHSAKIYHFCFNWICWTNNDYFRPCAVWCEYLLERCLNVYIAGVCRAAPNNLPAQDIAIQFMITCLLLHLCPLSAHRLPARHYCFFAEQHNHTSASTAEINSVLLNDVVSMGLVTLFQYCLKKDFLLLPDFIIAI